MTASTPLERALALLWGRDTRGSRGPARGLTLDRIVEAAIEVAEREGPAAMSLRRVAARLDVGVASLYTYVPGRAELEALMLDAVAIGRTLPHELPGDWRAKLTALAHDDWREIRRHPWVLELGAAEQVPGPNMLRWLDSALRIFDGTGLSETEKLSAIETVDAYVRGLGRLRGPEPRRADIASGTGSEADHDHDPGAEAGSEDTRERDQALGRLVDFDRYPALRRALAAGGTPYSGTPFEFGLERLLDGIEQLVLRRSP
ncbi:TetR/AcrR family transcriptional regulator C-terminal domain-containing protein [Streptomyces flavofungini]|uniref:TetR/AcrR family transcriptional regulator C-terminal domain-containing protein n=1 Tax=Streptomyces flavofungini TaxID=68200 RepID=A0ABS0XHX4_9ACTN|nr:TetR/AcrR family transcriptional regulator C-terminal domain-containing protein [Streptomyces flavofungini]